jgi:hypothetical protein
MHVEIANSPGLAALIQADVSSMKLQVIWCLVLSANFNSLGAGKTID